MLFSLPEAAFRPNQMLLRLAQEEKKSPHWSLNSVCEYSARFQAPSLVAATLPQRLPPATTTLQSISPPLLVQSPGSTMLFEAPSNRIETDTECVTSPTAYNKTWKRSIVSIIEVDYILSVWMPASVIGYRNMMPGCIDSVLTCLLQDHSFFVSPPNNNWSVHWTHSDWMRRLAFSPLHLTWSECLFVQNSYIQFCFPMASHLPFHPLAAPSWPILSKWRCHTQNLSIKWLFARLLLTPRSLLKWNATLLATKANHKP